MKGAAGLPLLALADPLCSARPSRASGTVEHLVEVTLREYHDEARAQAIADRLLRGLRSGRFNRLDGTQLAGELNSEVAAASQDQHFMIMAGEMAGMQTVRPTDPHRATLPFNERELEFLERESFGVPIIEVLSRNIGRIQIKQQFYRPAAEVRRRLGDAMDAVADTSALIIDLTETIGGDPHTVALFLSYFFDRPPFLVNRFRWRNLPPQEFRTTQDLEGRRYGETRPIVVLVSSGSYSAAEEFAYDVQVLRRGPIVGETTAGAANHALPVKITGGFTAFIPMARAENPVTGTNWEGRGVRPDVHVRPASVSGAHKVLLRQL